MIVKNDDQFQREVCKRDGYICQICKNDFSYDYYFDERGINQYTVAHHIKTKKARPDLRLETDNGICLCNFPPENCHTELHKGNKNLDKL